MQIGFLATPSIPGSEVAAQLRANENTGNANGSSEGGTGFEALLAALTVGNNNAPTNKNVEELGLDKLDPATAEIADALAGMAEALKPLAKAFDNLQIPSSDQLDTARAALGKLIEGISAHPNRASIAARGPVGAFASQLSELRKAGADLEKIGVSDFAKVGQLLERLDTILSQVPGAAPAPVGEDNNGTKAQLNIHQMIERLTQLAKDLPTLAKQFGSQAAAHLPFGSTVQQAQVATPSQSGLPIATPPSGVLPTATPPASILPTVTPKLDALLTAAPQSGALPTDTPPTHSRPITLASATGLTGGTTNRSVGDAAAQQSLLQQKFTEQTSPQAGQTGSSSTNTEAERDALAQLAKIDQQTRNVASQTIAQVDQAKNTATAGAANSKAEPDILAQLANLGQVANGEAKKQEKPNGQSNLINSALQPEKNTEAPRSFAPVTREANLQAAATYPTVAKPAQPPAAIAPLPSELDSVETGTEKLLAQHKIQNFQQQTNHIDTAQSRAAPKQVNIPGVAFEIVRQVRQGAQQFEIRLDPPEMGRIDVKMEMDGNNVTARLVVERPETLDFLQRDARALERALQQAGLNADRSNLEFSLKQDGQNGSKQSQNNQSEPSNLADQNTSAQEQVKLSETTVYRGTASPGGLNVWV